MMQVWIAPIMALVSAVVGALSGTFLIHKLTKSRYRGLFTERPAAIRDAS